MRFFWKNLFLVMIIWALSCGMAQGKDVPPDKVMRDLSVMEARVIKGPCGATFLNKGSKDQVRKGDLWTIYSSVEPVVDPVSGDRLGDYAAPLAVCRVRKAEDHYSEVVKQCFKDECRIEPGLKAVRYRDIEALYLDQSGSNFSEYKALRSKTGHLDWQGYEDELKDLPENLSSPFKLVIVAAKKNYSLWAGGELLADYSALGQASSPSGREEEVSGLTPAGESLSERPGLAQSGLVREIKIRQSRAVASLAEPVYNIGVAEIPETGEPYLLCLDGGSISARALSGEQEYRYSYQGFGEPVNMSVARKGLMALNIYVPGQGMQSRILRITEQGFQTVAEGIGYVLSFRNDPAGKDGARLLGQAFSQDDLLRPVVYRLQLEGGDVVRGQSLDLPSGYSIFGSFQADLNGNEIEEKGFFNPGGRLVIYESGHQVWESSSGFAASPKTLLIDDPDYEEAAPSELVVRSQPAVFRRNQDTYAALALNKKEGWTDLIGSASRHGTVGILGSSGGSYILRLIADRFDGPVQDIHVYRDELLIAVAGQGRTHILALPLSSLVPEKK